MISRWFQLGLIWHAIFKFDGEVTQGARPVWDGERPLAADVFQAQVEEFRLRKFFSVKVTSGFG